MGGAREATGSGAQSEPIFIPNSPDAKRSGGGSPVQPEINDCTIRPDDHETESQLAIDDRLKHCITCKRKFAEEDDVLQCGTCRWRLCDPRQSGACCVPARSNLMDTSLNTCAYAGCGCGCGVVLEQCTWALVPEWHNSLVRETILSFEHSHSAGLPIYLKRATGHGNWCFA